MDVKDSSSTIQMKKQKVDPVSISLANISVSIKLALVRLDVQDSRMKMGMFGNKHKTFIRL